MPASGARYSTLAIPGAGQISDEGGADMYLQQAAGILPTPVLHTSNSHLIRFDFAYELSAFGFDWFAIDGSVRMDAYDAAGLLLESLDIVQTDQNVTHFSGMANTSICSVVLTPLDRSGNPGSLDNYLIDDLAYVAAPRALCALTGLRPWRARGCGRRRLRVLGFIQVAQKNGRLPVQGGRVVRLDSMPCSIRLKE